jgi:carbonic anhydrase
MKRTGFLGRRDLLKLLMMTSATAAGWPIMPPQAAALASGEASWQRLLAGNQRFMQQQPQAPHQSLQRLQETAQVQQPFAIVLSCADSRVPPEILFDVGIGDLFDVRVAGNIITPEVIGSLEYAAVVLGTPLIVVLGHERCGAVTAAVKGKALPGKMDTLVAAIQPALGQVKRTALDVVETAVIANVQYQVYEMKRQSAVLADLVAKHQLKIVGARYDLDQGAVTIV